MPVTWSVGSRVRLKTGSKERTYTVQKIIVIKHSGIIRHGVHLYSIKDNKTGQLHRVKGEQLVHA